MLDLNTPHKEGVTTIREIRKEDPEAKILILTNFVEDHRVVDAIKARALGYLLKDSMPEELIQAIRAVHRGESSLSLTIALKLVQELSQPAEEPLTPRETQVLRLVAQGLTNQEIGERLTISERTVGVHVSTILAKLELANRTQAALYALREGLVELDTRHGQVR